MHNLLLFALMLFINISFREYVSLPCLFLIPTNFLHQIMSVQQLYRVCTLYWDANYNTRTVSQDVSFFSFPFPLYFLQYQQAINMLKSFRSFQAWRYLWLRTLIMLRVILSCWTILPGESACLWNANWCILIFRIMIMRILPAIVVREESLLI